MNDFEKAEYEKKLLAKNSSSYELLRGRIGLVSAPKFQPNSVQGINDLAHYLANKGGLTQQERMIRDKRRTLDKAVLYSYQGAFVKKWHPDYVELMPGERERPPVRALINPDKNKQDYDDKIISIGFEHDYRPGDIFDWCGTGTYWLIYLQELTELAYFRGEIRKCRYQIKWLNENREERYTYVAVRGPVETRIDYIQKHTISVDNPNHSLHILMPKNDDTVAEFKRYTKFYLQGDTTCWRVEAVDSISTPGILELEAVEYYANTSEDDIEGGIAGALIAEPINPNDSITEYFIKGDTFIKPKIEYKYEYVGKNYITWVVDNNIPVKYRIDENNPSVIYVKWMKSYHGQFDIKTSNGYTKTIVVESMF